MNEVKRRNFLHHLQRNAPDMTVAGFRQSRRIQGYMEMSREEPNYRQVVVYLEKGIGEYPELLKSVVETVCHVQDGVRKFRIYLGAFGFDTAGALKMGVQPITVYSHARTAHKAAAELAGSVYEGPCELDRLAPPRAEDPCFRLDGKDLLIIACRDRGSTTLSQDARRKLKPMPHVYRVYAEDEIGWERLKDWMKRGENPTRAKPTPRPPAAAPEPPGVAGAPEDRPKVAAADVEMLWKLYGEFQGSRGLVTEGYCPACELEGKRNEMLINRGDLFECPECHLLISLATPGRATILRRRGSGNFRSYAHEQGACRHSKGENLSREDLEHRYDSDGTFIRDRSELEAYLAEVQGTDPHV